MVQLFPISRALPHPRVTNNDHKARLHSCREKASKGESWLQVVNAYLNRRMRLLRMKYIIFSPPGLSQKEITCRTGLSLRQMNSTNQLCTRSTPLPLTKLHFPAKNHPSQKTKGKIMLPLHQAGVPSTPVCGQKKSGKLRSSPGLSQQTWCVAAGQLLFNWV